MRKIAYLAATTLLTAGYVGAQVQNGNVTGVVTDASGAVVAGAKVVLTNVATRAQRVSTTDHEGVYDVQNLTPSQYVLSVSAEGFAETKTAPFTVSVGSANKINAKLAVGQADAVVEVAANSLAGINLENSENSQVINSEQVLELPTETRNPYDLAALSGSVSSDPSGAGRGVGFNIGGARDASTEILLDGQENTGLFTVSVATPIPLDATQEFRILTSNYGAQYGRASGGIVNVSSKSGTNSIHGTAYEFYRPSTFASNGYYNNANGIPQHRFVRNNFGYSVGAPVLKDKLFAFSSTEWLRIRSSNVNIYYVPTADFIAHSNANTQAFFKQFGTVSGTPVNNFITVSQLASQGFTADATGLAKANPTLFTPGYQLLQQVNVTVPVDAGGGTPGDGINSIARVDFNPTDRTQMFARYVYYTFSSEVGGGNASPYAGYNTLTQTKAQAVLYSLTHIFSPRLTLNVGVAGLRYNNNQPLGANPAGPTLYINSASAPQINGSNPLVFPGYSETNAGSGIPSGGPQNDIQLLPTLTYLKGRHTMTMGGQYSYIRDNHTFGIYENATESLVQTGTQYKNTVTGVTSGALTNFYQGTTNYFQASLYPQGEYPCVKDLVTGVTNVTAACTLTTPISQPNFSRSNRYQEGAGFFQDDWKATNRMTINAGLRYELYGTQHNKNPNLDSNFYFGTSGTLQDQIRAGKILRTTDTAPTGVEQPNGKLWNTNYKQFAPRIGFSYDVTGDGRTALRGGYGISYERNFGNVTYNVALNPPNVAAVSITTADTGGTPIAISTGVLGQFSGGSGTTKALAPTTVRAVNPKIAPAYNQFYTLSLQRQVSQRTSVNVAYTGERGVHNYSIANYNRTYYGQVYEGDAAKYAPSGAVNTNRLNPQYTSINVRGADGDSYYSGVNVGVLSSDLFKQGLTTTVNYTYAHSLDNTSSAFTDGGSNYSNNGGVAYFDPFNHGLDHGNSDFDVRHRIAASAIWRVPYFEHTRGFERLALDGWEVTTIFTASTGTPFTMYDCGLSAVTVCPRARFLQKPSYQRTGAATPIPGGKDDFAYITFPAYTVNGVRNNAAYGSYVDPKVGAADLPTIVNGQDTFPGGMSSRNAFRGPGRWNGLNASVAKTLKFTDRLGLQLRAEAYDLTNHANEVLIFGGTNDVEYGYVQVQKTGPAQGGNRQLQLAGKFIF